MAEPLILVAQNAPEVPLMYACAKCGTVHSPKIYMAKKEVQHETARKAAEDCWNCKTHDNCETCGKETSKGWKKCGDCRITELLEKAEEVPDDGGPYCRFDGDDYYMSMEEAQDDGCEWVSPCTTTYARIDPDSIMENALADMFEEADMDDLDGVEEFYAAAKAFNEAQTTPSFFGDNKRKIRVPAREDDA